MTIAIDTANWGWPQYVMVGLYVFSLLTDIVRDGEPKTGKHSAGVGVVAIAIAAFILTAGGFFR